MKIPPPIDDEDRARSETNSHRTTRALKALADELRETHGSGEDEEYFFLEALYRSVETAKNFDDAEDRLREMHRFVASCWGFVKGFNRARKPRKRNKK